MDKEVVRQGARAHLRVRLHKSLFCYLITQIDGMCDMSNYRCTKLTFVQSYIASFMIHLKRAKWDLSNE
jgi:hypothetical protein